MYQWTTTATTRAQQVSFLYWIQWVVVVFLVCLVCYLLARLPFLGTAFSLVVPGIFVPPQPAVIHDAGECCDQLYEERERHKHTLIWATQELDGASDKAKKKLDLLEARLQSTIGIR